ncbi:hypothetical protein MLD38_019321 [Melastoma candidum]|uniref:Uncharacterized protein n=1 Tax=Melastoma candidum TaxID=119954 RepID=A0ACB9QX76_9MYRT|nr:hypothetical protein MLD38_019321 [Melastoma candidum]
MPEVSSEGGGRQGWRAGKHDRRVEVVEEVVVVEGEEGDEEDVEEIIVEEVEVIEEEEDEEEREGGGEGDGGEAGEEDMEFSEDERGESDPRQLAPTDGRNTLEIEDPCHLGISSSAMEKTISSSVSLDGQKGSSKSDPSGSKPSTSPRGDSSCDVKFPVSGKSIAASTDFGAKDSVASENVGAAHQDREGPTHSKGLFFDYPGYAGHSLATKDEGFTHMMSQDLSCRSIIDFKKDLRMSSNANNDATQIALRFPALVVHPRDLSPHGVLPEGNKRQAIICAFFAKGWCIRGQSCRFLHVKDNLSDTDKRNHSTPDSELGDRHSEGLGNGLRLKSSGFTQSHYESGFLLSNTDAERLSAGCYDNCARSEVFAVHGPSSSVSPVSTYRQEFPSSYAPTLTKDSQDMSNWNQKVKTPFNSKVFTPDNFSAQVIPMKDLDSTLQYQPSHSGSALGNGILQNKSTDSNIGSGYGRFSAYDWEPSEPFRPSFIISSTGRFSLASQFDPFQDGAGKCHKGEGAFGSTYATHGASFSNTADDLVGGNLGGRLVRECERCSGSSHNKCSDHGIKKDSCFAEREKFSGIDETAESIVKKEDRNDKNDGQSDYIKDAVKDRVRHKLEMDGPHRTNWDGNRESRALRNFRVSLIELVKEILRPTWEKGLISKDVHNSIVKKSVEKVLNTLEPQSVPPSEELTKQYLSVNEPKIVKLIEGYVEKYGKS